ncbi:hypothetical protein K490DRAFT_56318 [Saccharata proteae CBS 121410]|uniref:BAH domain-containing protein n=1 Tax=Saccharata proteae CBS 121410 TaxID=1314787 RepID=A0A9P4HUJ9_9PEZI|nr:hypothetical protein K490DRAFT_56318 [Saccharata proteae CBS 121410]
MEDDAAHPPTPSSVPESSNGADSRRSISGPLRLDWADFDAEFGAFTIELYSAPPKKRKRGSSAHHALLQQQRNPPRGTSDADGERLSTSLFTVEPSAFWEDTRRYRNATIQDTVVEIGDFVFVQNDETPDDDEGTTVSDWVAKILEIRAGGPAYVFFRVYWVYRPEDLLDGRQPHHGEYEVIPTNAMQIIDASTVNGTVKIQHWRENEESQLLEPETLFWRQTLDDPTQTGTGKFSSITTHCIDEKPFNPDTMLIHCPTCNNWLHGPCIEAQAVTRAYEAHGIATPTSSTPDPSTAAPASAAKRDKKKEIKPTVDPEEDEQPEPLFSAQVRSTDGDKTMICLTDRRGDQPKMSEQPVHCLFEACRALIE